MTIFNEYIDILDKHKKIYGDDTTLFMMVGGFYEIYGIPDNNSFIGENIIKICKILNISYTKKNKNIQEISFKNPYMAGFPIASLDKYIEILINNNYTIIIVDQIEYDDNATIIDKTSSKKNRDIVEIISPTTYIHDSNKLIQKYNNNNILSIYFYKFKSRKTKEYIFSFSISIIDLSIGNIWVYDHLLYNSDNIIDTINKFIQKYNPNEVLLYAKDFKDDDLSLKFIDEVLSPINGINLTNTKMHNFIFEKENKIYDISYQNEVLYKIYKDKINEFITPIEYIELEKQPDAIISLIALLNFSYQHNNLIISNLNKPFIIKNDNNLLFDTNIISKLNLINNSDNSNNKSLINILNVCATDMGKRYFEECLLNPLIDIKDINKRYDSIDLMLTKFKTSNNNIRLYQVFQKKLNDINDIERKFRKLSLIKDININIFPNIISSLQNLLSLKDKIKDKYNSIFYNEDIYSSLVKILKFIDDTLDFNNDLDSNKYIFKKGIYPNIDDLQNNIQDNMNIFTSISKNINSIKEEYTDYLKIDKNDKMLGYSFIITKNRYNIIKRYLSSLQNKDKFQFSIKDNIYTFEDFEIKHISSKNSNIRLTLPVFNDINYIINNNQNQLDKITRKYFLDFCSCFTSKFHTDFNNIITYIKHIDFYSACAKNAHKYKYVRPSLIESDKSYVDISSLRHPIIEIINQNYKYITNDIKLGIDYYDGILLYGINSSGKSSLMKSIGLAIIMAQSGMFVSANSMKISPYKKIFCRIPGGDDLYSSKSTFVCEMLELKNILNGADKNTMVIGDELCSGTETTSAISIVSSGILHLIKKNTSFIFASHLHELVDLDIIKNIHNLQIFHLSVICKNGKLIFDRKLKKGNGDKIYGLEVAKSLNLDQNFLTMAIKIRKDIIGDNYGILKYKKSRYNSDLIIDKCEICHENDATETHHIRFQKEADEDGFIEHFNKNNKFNLLPLCEKCHNKIHNNQIQIGEKIFSLDLN
jgi:DNA mismatch repair protein MutS